MSNPKPIGESLYRRIPHKETRVRIGAELSLRYFLCFLPFLELAGLEPASQNGGRKLHLAINFPAELVAGPCSSNSTKCHRLGFLLCSSVCYYNLSHCVWVFEIVGKNFKNLKIPSAASSEAALLIRLYK